MPREQNEGEHSFFRERICAFLLFPGAFRRKGVCVWRWGGRSRQAPADNFRSQGGVTSFMVQTWLGCVLAQGHNRRTSWYVTPQDMALGLGPLHIPASGCSYRGFLSAQAQLPRTVSTLRDGRLDSVHHVSWGCGLLHSSDSQTEWPVHFSHW